MGLRRREASTASPFVCCPNARGVSDVLTVFVFVKSAEVSVALTEPNRADRDVEAETSTAAPMDKDREIFERKFCGETSVKSHSESSLHMKDVNRHHYEVKSIKKLQGSIIIPCNELILFSLTSQTTPLFDLRSKMNICSALAVGRQ